MVLRKPPFQSLILAALALVISASKANARPR